jgi:hypothetical protein
MYVPHKDVGSYTSEVTEDGIRIVSARGATRLKWCDVNSIVQTRRTIINYLYDSPP